MPRNCTFKFGLVLLGFWLLASCSKDDEGLYSDREQEANPELLEGVWSIYQGELDGITVDVPENNPQCGRDFLVFNSDNTYTEFLFRDNYECLPEVYEYTWSLDRGVITIRNGQGQTEELVILELTTSIFVFRAAIDYDENGSRDLFTFTARPYNPPGAQDIYSSTFVHNMEEPNRDKIQFNWRPYMGTDPFDRYEIYRSDGGCDKSSATRIATITNRETNFFIDENPANQTNLCYYFRLYTKKGLLSESELVQINTSFLEVSPISLNPLAWEGENAALSWNPYSGNYFSHYEITVQNFTDGTGHGYEELVIAEIADPAILNYTLISMPYVANPVFSVRVVDIFGNRSLGEMGVTTQRQLNYIRPGLLDMVYILQIIPDPGNNQVFVYGNRRGEIIPNFFIFDYNAGSITAISDLPPKTSSAGPMKLIDSEEGRELLIPVGTDVIIYDAQTLAHKYSVYLPGVYISDLAYLGNSTWAFTDGDNLTTFTRAGATFTQIDQAVHFPEHQGYASYYLQSIDGNRVVVGHYAEPYSLTFDIDNTGIISNRTEIQPVVRSIDRQDLVFNPATQLIFGLQERNCYRTTDFLVAESYGGVATAYGISGNGQVIFGTDNDPSQAVNPDALFLREAVIHDRVSGSETAIPTQGYPLLIFESPEGRRISLSSYFRRLTPNDYTPAPDFFFEIVE